MTNRRTTSSTHPNHAARVAHARGEKMFRTYDTSAIQPKRSKVPAAVGVVLILVVVGLLAFGAFTLFKCCVKDAELLPSTETATVVVPDGAGASTVASALKEAGLISDTNEFVKRVAALNADTSLKPGTYSIQGGMATDDIIKVLQAGPDAAGAKLTIPEGYTLKQIAACVEEVTGGRITADEFTAAASDASVYASSYPFLSEVGSKSLEGFLFPKTYSVDASDTADSLIRMMLDQFNLEYATLDTTYRRFSTTELKQAWPCNPMRPRPTKLVMILRTKKCMPIPPTAPIPTMVCRQPPFAARALKRCRRCAAPRSPRTTISSSKRKTVR